MDTKTSYFFYLQLQNNLLLVCGYGLWDESGVQVERFECSYYRYPLQWLSCQSYVIDLASDLSENSERKPFLFSFTSLSLSPSANQLLLLFLQWVVLDLHNPSLMVSHPFFSILSKPLLCIPFLLNLYRFHHGSLSKSLLSSSCFMVFVNKHVILTLKNCTSF